MNPDIIVQNIKKLCKEKGLDETPACRDSGAGPNLIQDLKAGKNISAKRLQMIAKFLGVTTSTLMGEEMPTPKGEQIPRYNELTPADQALVNDLVARLFAAQQNG